MDTIKLNIPTYDKELFLFIQNVVHGFMSIGPIMENIPSYTTRHKGPIRNIRGPNKIDHSMSPVSASIAVSHETIRNTDLDEFCKALIELAEKMKMSAQVNALHIIEEVASATGNIIDNQGEEFSFDTIIKVIEKLGINFDENDQPIMPGIIIEKGTINDINNTEITDEQKKLFNEIILKERNKFYAQKRNRRLS